MSRSERLLDLLQLLRRYRRPVSGRALAAELGISIRTLYRDIATLQGQGADIEGEPGLGYVLRPGFMLPPLMFSEDEIEALVLGSRWVADRGDRRLGEAARNALAKIGAVLPPDLRGNLETAALLVGPAAAAARETVELGAIRKAIRAERRVVIVYRDGEGRESERTIWPFALSYFDRVRIVLGWCELRAAFRHFRTDRIGSLTTLGSRYPRRRQALLREWRADQGITRSFD
ncbi:helix-turn-helix transcriptional regulator [Phreatobacter sp. AB_2022a]|uniref:helix-turn-helix transcriptional regulator n=1 Tax=Phreatobacter sp. AB_2022a TaxID=3003134 RepID=UPI00228750D4|nr:YafY family protein [Phreatobacter sp. AB_2022a]MCZ0734256.1 YafY family protein [Phreatobacter sp. AB_2022a]